MPTLQIAIVEEVEDLEATVEQPRWLILQQIEDIRRRMLVNAGLVKPMGELEEGFMTRRQAS